MIIFLNHRDRLFCDVFETPNNNKDYFTIITIIGPTINRSDASLKSIKSASGQDTGVLQQMKVLSRTFLGHLVALSHIKLVRMGLPAQANATNIGCWTDGKGPQVWLLTQK